MDILDRIRELCTKADISIARLEKETGLANGSIRKWEKTLPSADRLEKVADYFNVTTDYLLGRPEIVTKAYHNLDAGGLPDEAIKQIEDYIDFINQKYYPDGTLKENR